MITIERLRGALRLPASADGDLTFLRSAVISQWESLTKRLWEARTDYEEVITVAPLRSRQVFLNLWPVTTITTVEEREANEDDWTEVDSDLYTLIGRRRLRRLSSDWDDYVQVTYTGGVAEADEDIQQALIAQVKFLHSRLADEKIITQSQNFEGGAGVFLAANIHPLFKLMTQSKKRKI